MKTTLRVVYYIGIAGVVAATLIGAAKPGTPMVDRMLLLGGISLILQTIAAAGIGTIEAIEKAAQRIRKE